jgi:YegS/Rv2252/BmrU family lipid kinase
MNGRNFLLVYNPRSGKGSFLKKIQEIKQLFSEKNLSFEFVSILNLNNNQINIENYDTVVAIGGDGTVLSLLPYLVRKNINLGIIPCGTANLLAEKLSIPLNIEQAVELLINGTEKLIDVGKIGTSYFVLRVGYGIDADIINGANSNLKNKFGYFAYLIQGIKCAFNLRPRNFEIKTDKGIINARASAVIVSNAGNMFKGKCSVAPANDLSDGKLDVFVLYAKNILEFLTVVLQIIFNKHKDGNSVLYEKVRSISIKSNNNKFHVDGEVHSPQMVDISLLHNALAVITP